MTYRCHFVLVVGLLLMVLPGTSWSQTEPVEGLHTNTPNVHALTGATIVVSPGQVLQNATLVIRDGTIEAVGTTVSPPADARVWDVSGRTLYPGFIDAFSSLGMPNEPPEEDDDEDENNRGLTHWNPQVRSFLTATGEFKEDEEANRRLRTQGFTAAHVVPPFGIFQGESAVMSLGNGSTAELVVRTGVAQGVSLQRSREFGFGYPTSAMGTITLIRQILHDADWYERAHQTYRERPQGLDRPETNPALEALVSAVRGEQPLLFQAGNEEEVLRSLRFADEFAIDPWIRGSGYEYRILDALAGFDASLILPVDYPDKPDVDTPEDALSESLSELRHWYLAPENPARLANAGLSFALTADGLNNPADFLPNVRKAVARGLNAETALASLTTTPANMLGLSDTHGTLEPGKTASIVVADGDLFEGDGRILDVWVDGRRYEVESVPTVDPRGEWQVAASNGAFEGTLHLEGRPQSLNGHITLEGQDIELSSVSVRDETRRLRVDFPGEAIGHDGRVRLSASVSGDELIGWSEVPGGQRFNWHGERMAPPTDADEEDDEESEPTPRLQLTDIRPAMEYGRESIPEQPEHIVVRNATIWTMGPQGILEDADLLVASGEIVEVGQNLQAPSGALEIDAEGRHVTPGLIDAHLHSGVSGGVNEIGSAIVPEVRIGDVLTTNNIWMYRQLAGGLTSAHVMHGSANPIGGQNALVKMRWGSLPEDLKIDGAPRTVKFALGENPKRVGSDRYPETRMGTQQLIADYFSAARDYRDRWEEWESNGNGLPPRRDLRMEALVDILQGDILVMSHSYRQDEILALMRLAEQFDIQIQAFHHGVEAYKVAPELADHGAGAVVWSDWSSFKIEAYDGTLYNARLLHEAGVLTSLHSDNSQIASRMNWEAAKLVGAGMDEEDALALVTSNTAAILGIDDRVGSLEPGKDADFVIWSDNPLSTFTRAEQTWVDGRKYFDLEEDEQLRQAIEEERSQLIELILADN